MAFDKNTVVWASAGTGKTRKLVDVYLSLLEEGLDPLRIVAVTFTEKAAAEMRERIRAALYAKQGQWMKTISIIPAAPISTIHGFCGMLLREHGLKLQIDPAFTILDEQRSLDLARESARETIREEIRSGNEAVEVLFGDFGLARLVETTVSAGYWLNSLGFAPDWLESRVEEQDRAAAALERDFGAQIRSYGDNFEKIGEMADELEARKTKHPLRKRDDPRALLPRIGQIAGVGPAKALVRLVGLAAERFRAKKMFLSGMAFDDLLLGARNLLRDFPDIRHHYQNQFQALLVDEFQDTDEVQAEIISLLAEDPENPGRLAARKLLIVGDPKQSIYRFRRARVAVFFRMLQRVLDEGGALEHLQHNYRSAAPIAEFANIVSQSMMDGKGKVSDLGGEALDLAYRIQFTEADLLKPKSESPFLGITYIAAESGVKAAQGREMEAEAVARLLKKWKMTGTIQSWKEVAVLLRAMTNLEIYLSALETHGIPVYVVQGTAFYQKTEVSDLIALLELVLHPDDQLLRSTVLTSSLIGLTFRELLNPSESLSAREGLDHLIEGWIERRDSLTAAEILQEAIRSTDYDVVMMAQGNGRQRVANIGKLIEITRDLARQGTTALDDVVRYLRDRAQDTTVREQEAQIVGQEDEVVRVLTVHQAKGLEFDIVVLPDLAAKPGRSTGDRTFFSDRWGILAGAAYGLHRKPLPHALILEAKDLEDDQQYEEEKRLLYVALTRARKMLVLGEGFAKGGAWLQWIEKVFEAVQPGAIAKARDGKPVSVRFKGFSVKVVPASQLNVPEQLTLQSDTILIGEPRIPMVQTPRSIATLELTPSDLSSLGGCFRYFQETRLLGNAEPGRESTGDTPRMRVGSVVHKILETTMVPAAEWLESTDLRDLYSVFESEDWKALMTASPEREMPFIMHIAVDGKDCWIRGRMDAVVPGDIPRVIDYKYATWRGGAETDYEFQMTAYALALMKAIGTSRAIAELWYLKAPMKIVRSEYSFSEAEGRLRDLIARYMRAIESSHWPTAVRDYCDRIECGFRSKCWQ